MSGLLQLLSKISPPPAVNQPYEYDGLEYRWKAFVFRPAVFKWEGAVLGIIALYLALFFIGKFINEARAKKAIAPYQSLISSNFSATRPLLSSGPSQHLHYSSGRRNTLALHGTLTLQPYHDVVGLAVQFGKSIFDPTFDGSEGLVWSLTLGRGEHGLQGEGLGVWAVVDKGVMRQVKEQRWDLSFAKLQENVAVPYTHALFTEHSEVNDAVFKTANVGAVELLANKTAASILKYLLISDQPSKRPAKGALATKFRTRQVTLSLKNPSNQAEVEAAKAWLQVIFNIADLEARPNLLKPDVARKIANVRKAVNVDLEKDFAKEQAEDNPPEITAEEKRLAKKREAREKLSEKELKKLEELEKKREMRKLAKRQQGKGGQ